MNSSSTPNYPQAQILVIVWIAMLSSLMIYGVILFSMLQQPVKSAPPAKELLWILQGLGFVMAVAGLLFNRSLYNEERIRTALKTEYDSSPGTEEVAVLARVRRWSGRLFVFFIISFALCEMAAVFGFVAGMLSRDMMVAAPVMGIALVSLLLCFPRPNVLMKTATRISASLG